MPSTNTVLVPPPPNVVGDPLTMRELAGLLLKHYGITRGHYDLLIEFKFGFGAVGPGQNELHPGIAIGLNKIGLAKTEAPGPLTFDAEEFLSAAK